MERHSNASIKSTGVKYNQYYAMFYNNVIIAHVNYYFILLKTIYFKVDLEISNKPKI